MSISKKRPVSCCGIMMIMLVLLTTNMQAGDTIQLMPPPADKGYLLNQSWKYQTGDNPEWASPLYMDKNWSAIDPSLDIHKLPQLVPGKIGWFRLHIDAGSLTNIELGLILQQAGASEIYLDGKLIHRLGVVSNIQDSINAYDPKFNPLSLILPDNGLHVIAVRFVLQPGLMYTTMFECYNPAIDARLFNLRDAMHVYRDYSNVIVGFLLYIIGSCFLLFFLHFAFYLFYPQQTGNRAFAIYALGFLLFNFIQYEYFLTGYHVAQKFYLGNLAIDLRMTCNLFLLTAIYKLLDRQRDKVYLILIVFCIFSVILNIWPYDIGWRFGGAMSELLIGAGIMRIAYLAYKKKKRGAGILLTGAIGYFIFFAIFFQEMTTADKFLWNLPFWRMVFYVLSFMCIPVATSIVLGLDFAFTNRSLNEKLKEVETLSEKNIRQEKEKQEILSAQNRTLETQVHERTIELTKSLQDLKSTQSQLIQSEKMASLGELTAGIAHEIQNPLNFVNNFSELNKELLMEMKAEIDCGNLQEVKIIADDVIDNEEKISHHGQRADAIVKSMLQHSHGTIGQLELVDINALADEYLRISYHGFRANEINDPTGQAGLHVKLKTDLHTDAGMISIIPQDIGKVLLNLFNNAFYAVMEKKNKLAEGIYEPEIWLKTQRLDGFVEISISDNGIGISGNIRDKIFQPFFTTKPTGNGTGLGLSLSYDIIKAHGGELKLDSNQMDGATFIITLPL